MTSIEPYSGCNAPSVAEPHNYESSTTTTLTETRNMIDPARSLIAIRAALNPIRPDSTDKEISAATDAAEAELALVASAVADFANQLDDGTGFSNSSTDFGRQLARHFDKVRRGSTVMGVLNELDVAELLLAFDVALLRVTAQVGPHAARRVLLTDDDRAAIERVRAALAGLLLEAAMPADPEYEDENERPSGHS